MVALHVFKVSHEGVTYKHKIVCSNNVSRPTCISVCLSTHVNITIGRIRYVFEFCSNILINV